MGFKIGNFTIGRYLDPYIIAEIGVNHGGDLALAKRLIDEAAKGGAHGAKFQTYKAEKLASVNSPAYWDRAAEPTASQYELFKKFDTFNEDDYKRLAEHCKKRDIDFLSTPFDSNAVEFLSDWVPAFKIASADITNVPLIRQCASSGKPLILSTGAASLHEIAFAVQTAEEAGAKNIALLHCVLNYPTPEEHAQLAFINTLQQSFPNYAIGYSDHVVPDAGLSSLLQASLLGAVVLEKHFTHDRSLTGNDHYHAMDQAGLHAFTRSLALHRTLYGHTVKDLSKEESAIKNARRSIVAAHDIRAGELFSHANLMPKRPGHGISPVHWDAIIGKRAAQDVYKDELLQWCDIDTDL